MDSEGVVLLLALVAGIVIAGLVANDARKRGMTAWVWFIGVFLLLIVALPIYFIVRKPLLPKYRTQVLGEQPSPSLHPAPLLCSECGKYYAGSARFCPHCGKSHHIKAVQLHCSNCGAEIAPTSLFCGSCGTKAAMASSPMPPAKSLPDSKGQKVVALLLIVIVGTVGAMIYLALQEPFSSNGSAAPDKLPDAKADESFPVEFISPFGELYVDSCTRSGTVVHCKVHAGASARFESYRFSASAIKWDGALKQFVNLPGVLVSAPDVSYGRHAEFKLIIPENADKVYLHYR